MVRSALNAREEPAPDLKTGFSFSHLVFEQGEDFEGPFFAMDRMMSNMRNTMLEMQRKFVSFNNFFLKWCWRMTVQNVAQKVPPEQSLKQIGRIFYFPLAVWWL